MYIYVTPVCMSVFTEVTVCLRSVRVCLVLVAISLLPISGIFLLHIHEGLEYRLVLMFVLLAPGTQNKP